MSKIVGNSTNAIPQAFDDEKQALDVGLASVVLELTPTLDTSAYASGDRLGSIMTLTGASRATGECTTLIDVAVIDQAKQSQAFDIEFFDESPTVASADNAAIDISDSEMADKWQGRVSVATTDYAAFAGNSSASPAASVKGLKPIAGSKNLFALLVCRSGTPTYAAGSLVIKFKFAQD